MSPLGAKAHRHGPTGRLLSADGLSVPVSITDHGEDLLLVVLDGLEQFTEGQLTCLMLESTGARGVVRTAGAAELVQGNLLRFVPEESLELVQRREFVRVTAAKRVILEDEAGEVLGTGLTSDISGGGMLVQLPRSADITVGTVVFFSLFLGMTDYDEQVNGTARILRKTDDNRAALAFDHISNRDQERLIRFVFERQRAALRVTRGDTL